jgi:hypothetical protein
MKVLPHLQSWQTILPRYLLPTRTLLCRRMATAPGLKGAGIQAVEAEAEAEGSIGAEGEASVPRIQGDITRKAIWAAASGSTQSGSPFSYMTN